MSVHFKLVKPDFVTRKVAFPHQPTWPELASRIEFLFEIPAEKTGVTYTDNDGDEVTLSSEEELQDFYQASYQPGQTVKFVVQDLRSHHATGRETPKSFRNSFAESKSLPEIPIPQNRGTFGQEPDGYDLDGGWHAIPGLAHSLFQTHLDDDDGPGAYVEELASDARSNRSAFMPPRSFVETIPGETVPSDLIDLDAPRFDKGKGRATDSSSLTDTASVHSLLESDAPSKPAIHVYDVDARSETQLTTARGDGSVVQPGSAQGTVPIVAESTPRASVAEGLPTPVEQALEKSFAEDGDAEMEDPPVPSIEPEAPATSLANDVANLLTSLNDAFAAHPEVTQGVYNIFNNITNGTYWAAHREAVGRAADEIARGAREENGMAVDDLRRVTENEAGRRVAEALGGVFQVFSGYTGFPNHGHGHHGPGFGHRGPGSPHGRHHHGPHPHPYAHHRHSREFEGRGRGGRGRHHGRSRSPPSGDERPDSPPPDEPRGHPGHHGPFHPPPPPPGPHGFHHLHGHFPPGAPFPPGFMGGPGGVPFPPPPPPGPDGDFGHWGHPWGPRGGHGGRGGRGGRGFGGGWGSMHRGGPPPPQFPFDYTSGRPLSGPSFDTWTFGPDGMNELIPARGDILGERFGDDERSDRRAQVEAAKALYKETKEQYRQDRERRKQQRERELAAAREAMAAARRGHESTARGPAANVESGASAAANAPQTAGNAPSNRGDPLESTAQVISNARGSFPELSSVGVNNGGNSRTRLSPDAIGRITRRLADMGFTESAYPALPERIASLVPKTGLAKEEEDNVVTDLLEQLLAMSPKPPVASGSGTRRAPPSIPGSWQ